MTHAFLFAATVLGGALLASSADADCHFRTDQAIACARAQPAAEAFQLYGFDAKGTDPDYVRKALADARCGVWTAKTKPPVKILEFERGRWATLGGWIDMVFVNIDVDNQRFLTGYVASDYLVGTCEKVDK